MMTCQQTTTETLKRVYEETMLRVNILECKNFDVNNTDCHDGNTCQAKPQLKNRVIRDCVSMTVELLGKVNRPTHFFYLAVAVEAAKNSFIKSLSIFMKRETLQKTP